MTKDLECQTLTTDEGISFSFIGPSFDKGLLPAVFYFALSSENSLCQDPYNQPVQYLAQFPIRVFSLSIPSHDLGLGPSESLKLFAKEIEEKKKPIEKFVKKVQFCLSFLEKKNLITKEKIGLMGLSRGGLIASHVAAKEPKIPFILQFSPSTKLSNAQDFKHIEKISDYDVHNLSSQLYNKTVRIYIGNRDIRVGTENAFSFCQKLVEEAFTHNIRSPKIELRLFPSIGHQGHGTSIENFNEGALWLAQQLQK